MKFLKSVSLSLLGLVLFVALSSYGLAYAAKRTVMDRDFVARHVASLDIAAFLKEAISPQISQQLTQQVAQVIPGARERVAGVIDATITELDPWMKKQSADLIYAAHDYATGRSQSLNLTISLETLRETLRRNMRQAITQAPELAQMPAGQRDAMVDTILQQLVQPIPSTLDVSQSLGPGFRQTLDGTRQALTYFPLVYWGLLAIVVLSGIGIVLILRDTRAAFRNLGTTFLTFGAFEYVGILVTKYLTGTQVSSLPGVPASLQRWLPEFLNDLALPVEEFSIGVAAAGLVLLVVSFIIRRKPPLPPKTAEATA